MKLVSFFKDKLNFREPADTLASESQDINNGEIIYFTEDEIRQLVDIFDQSRIFKVYPINLRARIEHLARNVFLEKPSCANQLLTVFISESRDESVKDFIINRNAEFALQVNTTRATEETMKKYVEETEEKFMPMNQIKFENVNTFFTSDRDVAEYCARNKTFKPGSGHFDFIFDLAEKKDQTMKAKFEYLEKDPIQKVRVGKFSLGVPITENSDEVLMIELVDRLNEGCNRQEIETRLPIDPKHLKDENEYNEEVGAKYIRAYKLNPTDPFPEKNIRAQDMAQKHKITDLTERDEVVHIKMLDCYRDDSTLRVLFCLILRSQTKLHFGHVTVNTKKIKDVDQ